jgi:P pilus assembly protein, pilin FimA
MPDYLTIFIVMAASSGVALAGSQVGTATMTGQIVEAACSIATDDVWQEINFGHIPLREFAEGRSPASKPFHIHLVNCVLDRGHSGVWSDVSVIFSGSTELNSSNLFSTKGEGKGVGIRIADDSGYYAIPGQALPAVKLYENNNDLHFNVHLARNHDALAVGDLSTFIRFMVAYQ